MTDTPQDMPQDMTQVKTQDTPTYIDTLAASVPAFEYSDGERSFLGRFAAGAPGGVEFHMYAGGAPSADPLGPDADFVTQADGTLDALVALPLLVIRDPANLWQSSPREMFEWLAGVGEGIEANGALPPVLYVPPALDSLVIEVVR